MSKAQEDIQEVLDKWRDDESIAFSVPKTVLQIEEVLRWHYGAGGYTKADVELALSLVGPSPRSIYLEEACAESVPYTGAYSFDEMTLDDLNKILDTTINQDYAAKQITFLSLVPNWTATQQQNIGYTSVSASGKTYITSEVVEYFPKEDVLKLHHTSPKSFFHNRGVLVEDLGHTEPGRRLKPLGDYQREQLTYWETLNPQEETPDYREKRRTEKARLKDEWNAVPKGILVDLKSKILVFLDQPHWQLISMLKPLLSHDAPVTRSSIVEKTKSGSQASKIIFLRGYPSVIFLTVKTELNEQIKNRMFLLSAETSQTKISEGIDLIARRRYDETFLTFLEEHPGRIALKERILALKHAGIEGTRWKREDLEGVRDQYKIQHNSLKPRDSRDFPRLLTIIESLTLLNFSTREKNVNNEVIVQQSDIDAGKGLYDMIAPPNELGIEPELYYFWKERLQSALDDAFRVIVNKINDRDIESIEYIGIDKAEFRTLWYGYTGSHLSDRQLDRKLEQLEMLRFIVRGTDKDDKRKTKLYAPAQGTGNARAPLQPLDWLRERQLQGSFTISQSDWDKYGAECERRKLIVKTVGSDFEMTKKGRQAMQEGGS